MSKKIIFITITSVLVLGCSTFLKPKSNNIESEEQASNKGLVRNIAQVTPLVSSQTVVDPNAPPADPYLIKQKDGTVYNCHTIRTVTAVYKGKSYKKPLLNDDKQLNCPNIKTFRSNMPWKVTKDSWLEADEVGYSNFVKHLGHDVNKCNNLDRCLSSESANSLISEEDMLNIYYADCADLGYYLRAYYAYKNGLPFTFTSKFDAVPLSQAQIDNNAKTLAAILAKDGEAAAQKYEHQLKDTRVPQNGNFPTAQKNTPNTSGAQRDFSKLKLDINDAISSGTYRMIDGDFYSPKITPDLIKPGMPIYGVKGHVAVIYDIKPNGEMLVIDAHPGNSITHNGWIQEEFILDAIKHGGMFKKFRPIKVINATRDTSGTIISGQVVQAKNEELPGYSLEQYDSNNFVNQGKKISMHEWVNLRLSGGSYKFNPVAEITDRTNQLCVNFIGRVPDVQKAIDNGVTKNSIHTYPNNIFAADGDWETYSSPSSDLRRRADTLSLLDLEKDAIKRIAEKDPMVSYKGTNLKADLSNAFKTAAQSCKVTYKNSIGAPVTLSLLQLTKRVGLFSFDPYMCPEARWGASGAEYSTCTDSADKKEFYKLTQFIRNNNEKDVTAVYGYTLDDLRRLEANKSVNNNPNAINYDIATRLLAP